MAEGIEVVVTNREAFEAAMADIRAEVSDPVRELDAGAAALVAEASGNAPRLTGRLASAGRAHGAAGRRVQITVDTPYAAPIHWGWPGHNIRRRPYVVATWLRSSHPTDTMAGVLQDAVDRASART